MSQKYNPLRTQINASVHNLSHKMIQNNQTDIAQQITSTESNSHYIPCAKRNKQKTADKQKHPLQNLSTTRYNIFKLRTPKQSVHSCLWKPASGQVRFSRWCHRSFLWLSVQAINFVLHVSSRSPGDSPLHLSCRPLEWKLCVSNHASLVSLPLQFLEQTKQHREGEERACNTGLQNSTGMGQVTQGYKTVQEWGR